jgi:hypothetical protein
MHKLKAVLVGLGAASPRHSLLLHQPFACAIHFEPVLSLGYCQLALPAAVDHGRGAAGGHGHADRLVSRDELELIAEMAE